MSAGKVHSLSESQRGAVDPRETVWLSASAGTGKTQVLSARVLRLLLQPEVKPSQILCLTFTKAGAAEMANRVNEVLANWVRMDDTNLYTELGHIGAPDDPATRDRARTLFAEVLDCPGGGLRINTIHAFSQWLLAAFPEEANLAPGTRAMEDRDRVLLSREVLSGLLLDAEARGDQAFLDALKVMSLRMGGEDVERYLLRCADAREAWFGTGSWIPPLLPKVNRLLGLAEDASSEGLAALCGDDAFDVQSLRHCMATFAEWQTATGAKASGLISDWLLSDCAVRLADLDALYSLLITKDGQVRNRKAMEKIDPGVIEAAERLAVCITRITEQRALIELAGFLTPALSLGRSFALAWDEAKKREGLIDFNDQIRSAADLLNRNDLAEWIRYKLDRQFDHILIDEAQDTNASQWEIINALTGDFFSGAGQHDDALRTLFVVGDHKQAIFRFQGTSPKNFRDARERVRRQMDGAAGNAAMLRENRNARSLQDLGLGRSFRTARSILDFVDQTIAHIGPERLGLEGPPEPHVGEPREGLVTLWRPVSTEPDGESDSGADNDNDNGENDPDQPNWFSKSDRLLADRIAFQLRAWMKDGFPLIKGGHRRATEGDVMILVRTRKELAGLIVARLHARGVKVAGIDRLRLGSPLAVKDLVAALRFAAQPMDDLSLAALLVSPLIGWSQDDLLKHGWRDQGVHLWEHLRCSRDQTVVGTVGQLLELLGKADFQPPQALLHWLLVGPWQGRSRLVARLGREANDPIDELLNAAHAYATGEAPSLTGFLSWFDAGDGELKRENESGGDMVRVMTVHGSKGLQAPIVILADAANDPDSGKPPQVDLADTPPAGLEHMFVAPSLPLPRLRKTERIGRILEAENKIKAEEREEHWRLLYVAMTRAEEALFVTGSLSAREHEAVPESWFAMLAGAFAGLEGPPQWIDDPLWGMRLEHGSQPDLLPVSAESLALPLPPALPRWLLAPPGPEPRPLRPLAPSSLGEDHAADPPLPPGSFGDAARRGTLIHKLLERLPELLPPDRESAALRWLERIASDLPEGARAEMATSALGVLANDEWADLFSADALAEVPIAALVGERVVAGTIDRLLIQPDRIRLVDYKTARRPPASLAEVPPAILRQMAAYVAALEAAYPGRAVEAAVLYSQTPALIAIPPDVIAAHKPELQAPQESF
ncbi:MAG: double-strand break repair helicase AddA [Novosphingobium sp.]